MRRLFSSSNIEIATLTGLACGLAALALVVLLASGTVHAATGDIFTSHLSAEAVEPDPGPDGADGTATLWSYSDRPEICYEITVSGLAGDDAVTAGAIHVGEAGTAGEIVLQLFDEPPTENPSYGCAEDVDPQLQDDLFADPAGYYVEVSTEAYPNGAVRGQLELTFAPGIGMCEITVEPSTVAVGQKFVVSGDFVGYAEIYLVRGDDPSWPDPTGDPAATVPEGADVHVAFTATADDIGVWTAWATRPDTHGCVGSAVFTVVATPFTDIAGNPFYNDVAWIYRAGITAGCAATKYCPGDPVRRAQMASFLDRALGLPPTAIDFFDDDDGSIHEAAINRLAAAGITGGCATRRYCPGDPVRRDQMASFLKRALGLPVSPTDYFIDDAANTHEGSINALAQSGITGGCSVSPAKYCPERTVTREQMAAFLHRGLTWSGSPAVGGESAPAVSALHDLASMTCTRES